MALTLATPRMVDRWAIALLVLQVFAWRWPFVGLPLTSDAAIRAYVSLEILEGAFPYRDVLNNKPPVILYGGAFFATLAGDASMGYWLMEAAFVAMAAIVVFLALRKVADPLPALVLGSVFVLLSNVSFFYYFTPGFIEYPAAAFTALAYFLAMYGRRPGAHFVGGVSVVLALMSHQLSALACLPIWLWLGFRRRWGDLASHLAGVAVALGGMLLWLDHHGALGAFVYEAFTFGYFYFKAHPTEIAGFRLPYLYFLLVPLPFVLASIPFVIRKNRDALLVLLWLFAAVAALALTGRRLYAHYFVILAAPMTLALAHAWNALPGRVSASRQHALAGAFFVLLAGVGTYSAKDYVGRASERLSNAEAEVRANPYHELAAYLNAHPLGERRRVLYVGFGNPAVVALQTDTRMPRPFAYFGDFYDIPHPRQSAMTQHWMAGMASNPPVLVVEDTRHFYPVPEALSGWIREHYSLVRVLGDFRVFARRPDA